MKKQNILCLFLSAVVLALIPFSAKAQRSDPCPVPSKAIAENLSDFAKIQSDIDRFTLCIERAQLLMQLNELVIESEKDFLNVGLSNPGFMLDKNGADSKASPQKAKNADLPSKEILEKLEGDGWYIIEIFGAANNLQAKIARSDGSVAQVRAGDILPDGGTVASVNPTSVVVLDKNKKTELNWLE